MPLKSPSLFFVAVFRGNQKTAPHFQRTSLQPQCRSKPCDRIFQAQKRFCEPACELTTFAVEDRTVSSLHHPISFDELAQFGSKLAAGINCTSSSTHWLRRFRCSFAQILNLFAKSFKSPQLFKDPAEFRRKQVRRGSRSSNLRAK